MNFLLLANKAFVFDIYGFNALAILLIVLLILAIIFMIYKKQTIIEIIKDLFHSMIDFILKAILYFLCFFFILDKWNYIDNLLPLPLSVLLEVIVIILILPIFCILVIDKLMGYERTGIHKAD